MGQDQKNGVSRPINGQSATAVLVSNRLEVLRIKFAELLTSDSVKDIKDYQGAAEAVRKLAKSARAGLEAQNVAAELKIRSERRGGDILRSMPLKGGDRKSSTHHMRETLETMGISQNESTRWQKIASVPEDVFERLVADAMQEKIELTSASLMRLANAGKRTKKGRRAVPRADNSAARQTTSASRGKVDEIISELLDHWNVINGIVSPICDGQAPTELKPAQARHLRRLMDECKASLVVLQQINTPPPPCTLGGRRQKELVGT